MAESEPLFQITTTVEFPEDAERIGSTLVGERLAACVQIDGPIRSIYRWKGVLEDTTEYRLTIKTAAALRDEAMRRVRELHPYELPEIIFIPLESTLGYANWVRENTGTETIEIIENDDV